MLQIFHEANKDENCDGLSTEDFRYVINSAPDFARLVHSVHTLLLYFIPFLYELDDYQTSTIHVASSILMMSGMKFYTMLYDLIFECNQFVQ